MWGGIRVGEYFHFILDSCYLLFTLTHVCMRMAYVFALELTVFALN